MKGYKIILISTLCFAASASFGQSLETFLQYAVNANPELKALELQYEAAASIADQVSQLPQPLLSAGVPIESPETRLGPQVLMLSARQMFPWFGTLKSKEGAAIAMSKSEYEKIAATRLQLFYQVKQAYFNLYLLNETQATVKENIRLYNVLEQVAIAKVESGKSTTADVLRVQIKITALENQLALIENDKVKYSSLLNRIANRNIIEPINIMDSFEEEALLDFDLVTLSEKIIGNHPIIAQIDAKVTASEQRQQANRGMQGPMIGFGLDYSMVDKRTDAEPEFNGRDILIPKAMITVPIFRKQYNGKNREEDLRQQVLTFKKEDVIDKMISTLLTYKSQYDNALLNVHLNEKQIKSTQSAYDILLSVYSGKGEKFDELIQLQNGLLKYKLDLIKARVQSHLSKAGIDSITDF